MSFSVFGFMTMQPLSMLQAMQIFFCEEIVKREKFAAEIKNHNCFLGTMISFEKAPKFNGCNSYSSNL